VKFPCMKCHNKPYLDVDTIMLHFVAAGVSNKLYIIGECIMENPLRDMVMDA